MKFLGFCCLAVFIMKTEMKKDDDDDDAKCWKGPRKPSRAPVSKTKQCMEEYSKEWKNWGIYRSSQRLQELLEETDINETTPISAGNLTALLVKPAHEFSGLKIFANSSQAKSGEDLSNRKVAVHLPGELKAGPQNTVVFCMIEMVDWNETGELYDRTLYGLSVRNMSISNLQERVNITITLTTNISETNKAQCKFLDKTRNVTSSSGCDTIKNESHITCSCDHLTYFAVLLLPVNATGDPVLSIITIIGCSISLLALLITVLLFITHRKLREDDSKKIHISLAVALIVLNVHFLSSQAAAETSSSGLCIYVAVALHYSLLTSFMWMALEGFHLYLLLVKIFNIYIRRYLLKLSLVGWGAPVVIVSIVLIVDKNAYGQVFVDANNDTTICYITENTVKMVTTVGVFSLVLVFNVIMFGVTIKYFLGVRLNEKGKGGLQLSAKTEFCTLLTLMVLLGITWGLIFFSFSPLPSAALYIFCILNSLQGFFIFIYFVLSVKKIRDGSTNDSQTTKT